MFIQATSDPLSLAKRRKLIDRAQNLAWKAGELSRVQGGRTEWNEEDTDVAAYTMKLVLLEEEP